MRPARRSGRDLLSSRCEKKSLVSSLAARSPRFWLGFCFALALEIERHRLADEVLQGRLIDLVAFINVDRAPDVPFEARVEQACWVFQRRSLGKGHLHGVLVRFSRADDAGVGPDRSST